MVDGWRERRVRDEYALDAPLTRSPLPFSLSDGTGLATMQLGRFGDNVFAMEPKDLAPVAGDFLLYAAPDGAVKTRVLFRGETAWLTQRGLAELFGVQVPAIAKHLKNIFESGELAEDSVVSILETTAADGKNYQTRFYNLDAIIAVGYRVSSYQATQFRIWATRTLREFMVKGFVLDDERLKQGKTAFGKDYFEDLLERIREIRASERRFYQKITDIYALSADYDAHAPLTREFFATVQNKLRWAITGQTAAELIYTSADSAKLFMGLTTWKHAPAGKVLKSDVTVAKNYERCRSLGRVPVDEPLRSYRHEAQRPLFGRSPEDLPFRTQRRAGALSWA